MKALRFARTGTLDSLSYDEIPAPVPAQDEVRVKVHAASVNPSDVKNVLGKFSYTTLPRTPGRDFSGVVVDGPTHLVGTEVWGSGKELGFTRDGSHAEFLTVPAAGVSRKPHNLTFGQAASCGVPYLTALEALDRGGVHTDTTVLIIGLGAVGKAALALAQARGARVAVAARRPAHLEQAARQGVATIALTKRDGFPAAAREHFTDGAEVVFDTTGYWLPSAVSVLATGGRICVIAAPANGFECIPVLDLYRRGGTIVGVNSLLHDSVASAAVLDTLRSAFESNALPLPGATVGRPPELGIQTYRDIHGGAGDKFVLEFAGA
ncbi:zinc-binding alcohol dehydrogenase family protein [Rhodococcus sp. NPDC057014]|uniref:quinone oxidoreductase family protein n=1 Tax=Rhodococcus sp. NPDC057014 TaxID=3346000 RepID=UPI0036440131